MIIKIGIIEKKRGGGEHFVTLCELVSQVHLVLRIRCVVVCVLLAYATETDQIFSFWSLTLMRLDSCSLKRYFLVLVS